MTTRSKYDRRPAMLAEVLDLARKAPTGGYIDATLGGGGHAEAILKDREDLVLYGIDCDPEALEFAEDRLRSYSDRIELFEGRFGNLEEITAAEGIPPASLILFDFGLSSRQIDEPSRGFTYQSEAPLDMRMNPGSSRKASDFLNSASAEEIGKVIGKYGEQPGAYRIGRRIASVRKEHPLRTTSDLVDCVRDVFPEAESSILARVFQAIRIEINDELSQIRSAIPAAIDLARPGGIIVAISYHSLEDRIVNRAFRKEEKGCICPPDLPVCRCGHRPRVERVYKKPQIPGESEIGENPRARSAKLRAAKKLP